jgi:hypothetical protein
VIVNLTIQKDLAHCSCAGLHFCNNKPCHCTMQNEKERLFRFFQNKGKINAIKAEEIANILMKKRLKKMNFF